MMKTRFFVLLFCLLFSMTTFPQASGGQIRRSVPPKNTLKPAAKQRGTKLSYSIPQVIDLGLPSGTLWADRNVGANKVENKGYIYNWGDIIPSSALSKNMKYGRYSIDGNEYTKYNASDGKTVLDLEDDAAYVNLGNNWRIPSAEQLKELINDSYTRTIWKVQNGTFGLLIISRLNGNKLFLPAGDSDMMGSYWSSDLHPWGSWAYTLNFDKEKVYTDQNGLFWGIRYSGRPIRPILSK